MLTTPRPSKYVVACYQQKGLKDELIMTMNIAGSFAHAGKKTCLISANPKNPTVDMQKKRRAAKKHHLRMLELRKNSNTSSWIKSGIDVEAKEEDNEDVSTLKPNELMWPQDKLPDMSTLKFDDEDKNLTMSSPTLASFLSESMKGMLTC